MSCEGCSKRVLCVGLMCLDCITLVDGYPREDTDQRCIEMYRQRGGNASNSCTSIALTGEPCEYMGVMADTEENRWLLADLTSRGILHDHCAWSPSSRTPTATIIINTQNASRTILSCQRNLPELSLDDFKKLPLHEHKYKWIHFEGRPSVDVIIDMIQHVDQYNQSNPSNRIVTSVEVEKTRINLTGLFDKADVVFVSKEYAAHQGISNMTEAVEKLYDRCKPGATLICAWGEHGAAAQSEDGVVTSPAFSPQELVDTLAAGDTFNGATISALSRGWQVKDAIEFGCRVAGAQCGVRGWTGMAELIEKMPAPSS